MRRKGNNARGKAEGAEENMPTVKGINGMRSESSNREVSDVG